MSTISAEFSGFATPASFLRVRFVLFGTLALALIALGLYVKRYKYRAGHRLGTGRHSGTPVDPFYIARLQGKTNLIRRHRYAA